MGIESLLAYKDKRALGIGSRAGKKGSSIYGIGHIQWYEIALPVALGFSVINAKLCTWES